MVNTLLASVDGWFAGLLVVMVILTVLFGVILYLILKPEKHKPEVKTDTFENIYELSAWLSKLLEKEKDERKHAILEQKLHEVKGAEYIVTVATGHAPHPQRPAQGTAPAPNAAAPASPAPAVNSAPAAAPSRPAPAVNNAPAAAPSKPAPAVNPAHAAPAAQTQANPAPAAPAAQPQASPAHAAPAVQPQANPAHAAPARPAPAQSNAPVHSAHAPVAQQPERPAAAPSATPSAPPADKQN